jgi:hypothetical protein
MRKVEQLASELLRKALGGMVKARDIPGAPPGTHDFDLVMSDGRVISVEVTIWTDPEAQQFWRAASKHRTPSRLLGRSWVLIVSSPDVHVKTLQPRAGQILRELERRGITEFGFWSAQGNEHVRSLQQLGITRGRSFDWAPACIYFVLLEGGSVNVDAVAEAVEREAGKSDNLHKLRNAPGHERHLFVWIEPLSGEAAAAMGFIEVKPPRNCNLPEEIDVVWIATPTETAADLWRYDRSGGWQRC